MSFFSKVADFFTDGVVGTIVDAVKDYFPPSMSESEKAALKVAMMQFEHNREKELLALAAEADKEVTRRAVALEGSASDLKALPVVGRFIIFIRGCQRPLWGCFTFLLDYNIFCGKWNVPMTAPDDSHTAQGLLVIAINVLVLGFLFGERTVKNLMPLFTRYMQARGYSITKKKDAAE